MERERMTSSGLQCEVCVFHFKLIKGETGWIKSKFVKVCEWFDRCDRLNIIFKSRKKKIIELYCILKIVKNYHYISLIYRRKNMKTYKWKWHTLIKNDIKDNIIKTFIIKNYFLNLIL